MVITCWIVAFLPTVYKEVVCSFSISVGAVKSVIVE